MVISVISWIAKLINVVVSGLFGKLNKVSFSKTPTSVMSTQVHFFT